MNYSLKHFQVLLLLLCLHISLQAQQLVSGTVSSAADGAPLVGASIYPLTNVRQGTTTDSLGRFSLIVADSVLVQLVISYTGYAEQVVQVQAGGQSVIIELQPFSSELAEVGVTASRLVAEEFATERLNQLEIYTSPLAKADPLLAVNGLAAATTTDESASISLRGSSPLQTGIYLNNVPITDAVRFSQLNGIGTFSIFNTAILNRVDVFPGNPPIEFGNATAGAISLTTEQSVPKQSVHSVQATLAGLGISSVNPIGKKASLRLFGNYQPSGMLKAFNSESLEQLQQFRSGDVGVQLSADLGSKYKLNLFNYSLSERYTFLSEHPSASLAYQQQRQRNFTVANISRDFGSSRLSFDHGSSVSSFGFGGGNLQLDNRQHELFFSLNYQRESGRFQYKTGLMHQNRYSSFVGRFPQFSYALAEKHPVVAAEGSSRAPISEQYFYGKYFISNSWVAGAGWRKNMFSSRYHPDYWSYQLNLTHLRGPHKFIVSGGQYHSLQLPNSSGSALFTQQQQVSTDYSYKKGWFGFQTALFYKHEQQEELTQNIWGAEATVAVEGKKLSGRVSATWIDAQLQSGSEGNSTAWQPGPYNLNYFLKSELRYKFARSWELAASGLLRQGTFYQPLLMASFNEPLQLYAPTFAAEQSRLPNYAIVSLNVSRIIAISERMNAVAFAALSNVSNRQNVRGYSYSFDYSQRQPELFQQRTFFVGVVVNFAGE